MAGFTLKVILAQKAFILLRKAAIVNFLAKAIPMLVTAKGKMVLLRFATIKLKAAMIGLKAALPFGAILIGVDLVIGKIIEANRVQQEFNELIEGGGKAALEAASKQLDARRQVLEAQLSGLGTNRNDRGTRKRIQRELDAIDTSQGRILGRLGELEDAANATAAAAAADAEAARSAAEADERRLAAKQAQADLDARRKSQTGTLRDRIRAAQREILLGGEITEAQRLGLQYAFDQADLKRQFPDLTEAELAPLRKVLQEGLRIKQNALARKQAENGVKTELTEQEKMYQRIGQTISDNIVAGLMQSKSAAEALGNVLNNVANQLLTLGVNTLLKSTGLGIFSALPTFANGGRPPVGRPSVVGERGPELFVPDRAGTILPNGVGMGSTTITVNVSASETSADASNGQGASLGKAIGLAVQLELIKQKRPGGLLATV